MLKLKIVSFVSLISIIGFFLITPTASAQLNNGLCATSDRECLLREYPQYNDWDNGANGLCNPEKCDCSNIQKSLEYPTTETNNPTVVTTSTYCEQSHDECIEYRSNDSGSMALLCYQEQLADLDKCESTGPICSITIDALNWSASTNLQCFNPNETYIFTIDIMNPHTVEDVEQTIYTQNISVSSTDTQIQNIDLPNLTENIYARFRISNQSDDICLTREQEFTVKNSEPENNNDDTLVSTKAFDYCSQVPGSKDEPDTQRFACIKCVTQNGQFSGPEESNKIFTALGCISVDQENLASDLIRLLMGIAGGVALLSILAAAFMLAISQGDSNKVKQAKELITAAVSGLLFLIFSITILEFIGIDILHIPGLN